MQRSPELSCMYYNILSDILIVTHSFGNCTEARKQYKVILLRSSCYSVGTELTYETSLGAFTNTFSTQLNHNR